MCCNDSDKKDEPAADSNGTTDTTAADDNANQEGETSDANVAVFYYTFADTYIASVRTALDAKLEEMGITY